MEAISEMHVSEPGLVVADVAADDDRTAFAFHTALASMWATTAVERTTRNPAQPGVGPAALLSRHASEPSYIQVPSMFRTHIKLERSAEEERSKLAGHRR
ncbi:DUF6207 family protein [Streptomyces echinatus]|uniref:Uncharacterized protein n=1 Tax=Streptomyces echinatus TaxID=67293 RepID=A0A7W9PRC9_9ACTN|nr:DUF6207 family protein [Streptomyces echinatus]MBB5926361.1 hypothetical protein [Streptomyces echinatus]